MIERPGIAAAQSPSTTRGGEDPASVVARPAPRAGTHRSHSPRRRRTPFLIDAVLLAGWFALALLGGSYYRLAPEARLHHEWYGLLKPCGAIGLAYGYLGTAFILLLLGYSLRKRWRPLRQLGALRRWLDVHITFGLLGPGFITLHAGFRIHGAIAIGYWAMIGVMASGFVGYYLYRQLPKLIAGHSDQAELLRVETGALDQELCERFGLDAKEIDALRRAAGVERAAQLGALGSLGFLIAQDLRFAFGMWRFGGIGRRHYPRAEAARLRGLVRSRILVERRRVFLRQSETLFGYWHTIHKPFAIVLYVMMTVHIAIAVWLGYAWVW
jgi:hypothetical protein